MVEVKSIQEAEVPINVVRRLVQHDRKQGVSELDWAPLSAGRNALQAGEADSKWEEVSSQPMPRLKTIPGARVITRTDNEEPESIEESEEERIERLGRERPAMFKSLGAELAFCYAILASQFMSVCGSFTMAIPMAILTEFRSTSYLASMLFFPP